VVPQGNYDELCTAIASLAESPALRAELGAAGARLAPRLFSAGGCLEKYRNLVLSLTDK
jgi:glycosyltransferase involved in cell wall biosynthesis